MKFKECSLLALKRVNRIPDQIFSLNLKFAGSLSGILNCWNLHTVGCSLFIRLTWVEKVSSGNVRLRVCLRTHCGVYDVRTRTRENVFISIPPSSSDSLSRVFIPPRQKLRFLTPTSQRCREGMCTKRPLGWEEKLKRLCCTERGKSSSKFVVL